MKLISICIIFISSTLIAKPACLADVITGPSTVNSGQVFTLNATGGLGSLQWQLSPNNSLWINLFGATKAKQNVIIQISFCGPITLYFRAKRTEGFNECFSNVLPIVVTKGGLVVDAGPDKTVIFNSGPGPQPQPCVDLTATATGGTGNYTYRWNTGARTQTITVCPTVDTKYSVRVSNGRFGGCGFDTVLVTSIDIATIGQQFACFNQNIIKICHIADCTSKCVNAFANCSSKNSLCAHLNHGDYLGPCTCKRNLNEISSDNNYEPLLRLHPNPFTSSTRIEFSLRRTAVARLEVYDIGGRKVDVLFSGTIDEDQVYSVLFNADGLPAGIYINKLISEQGEVYYQKMIYHK